MQRSNEGRNNKRKVNEEEEENEEEERGERKGIQAGGKWVRIVKE